MSVGGAGGRSARARDTRTPNIDPLDAAALPAAGTTALHALTVTTRVSAGQRVLIRGAAWGVGSLAVQLAHSMDAHVTALASQKSLDWVRSLGADEALDYRTANLAKAQPFDVIVDLVGTDLPRYRRLLTPTGTVVALAIDPAPPLSSAMRTGAATIVHRGRVRPFSNNPSADELRQLTALVEQGSLRPLVDAVIDMADIAQAHRELEQRSVHGKIVIRVSAT